jgi:hypothetical protein
MVVPVRRLCALAVLLTVLGTCRAADEGLSREKISKIGMPATALVEVKARGGYGSAFCIHPSGLFLTNEHVAQGDITVILNPSLKTEKSYPARVVRSDKELDLALLRVEGVKDLSALTLGSDENLEELMELVAFGFPFGPALAPGRREYPAVSVNVGSITSLRRKEGNLYRIQLDAALNPGNSGGPVLDKNGKVVGVVVAGVQGSGVNFAIPVSTVARFVARPEVQFDPPLVTPGNIHKPVQFEAKVTPLLPSAAPLTVDLILKPAKDKERTHRMEANGDKYRVTAMPVPPPPGPLTLRLVAQFDNGKLEATVIDRGFKICDREMKLSEVRGVRPGATPQVVLHDGKKVEGTVSGLDAVLVRLGEQTLAVNLAKAAQVKITPAVETAQVGYTLLVRQSDKEIFRQSKSLDVEGLLEALIGVAFVSDMEWIKATSNPGSDVRRNTNHYGNKIHINRKTYAKSLWTHAFINATPADVVLDIAGKNYTLFAANVGIEDASGGGSVEFQVLVDGKLKAKSPVMRPGAVHAFRVAVKDGKEVTLRVLNGGDGNDHDHAAWGWARFIEAGKVDPLEE